MKFGLTIILLFLLILGHAQQTQAEFAAELKQAKHDTTKAILFANWGELVHASKPDTAIILFRRALSISIHKARWYDDPHILELFTSIRASMYNNLAYMYEQQGLIKKALEYNDLSLHLYDSTKNESGQANSLNNIGFIFSNQGETDKAESYYRESISISQRIGDSVGLARTLNNMGLLYRRNNQYDSALFYYDQSLAIRRKLNAPSPIANSLNNIGYVYLQQKEFDRALSRFKESNELHLKANNLASSTVALKNIGVTYRDSGIIDSALYYGHASCSLAQDLGYPKLLLASAELLYSLYREQGDYEKALSAYEMATEMQDSILNMETQTATIKMEVKHEYEKQELIRQQEQEKEEFKRQQEQEKKDAIQEEKEKRLKLIILEVSIGLLLLLGLLVFVYSRMRIIRKQKVVIEDQKQMVEAKNSEITDSITYAKRIQNAILPTTEELTKLDDHFVFFLPKDIVSGDFYWLEQTDNSIYVAVADCTGHGVPGAMVSVVCSNALTKAVKEVFATSPSEILNVARDEIIGHFVRSNEDIKDGMDIALCRIFPQKDKMEYAGAHNPLWLIRDGELHTYTADKQPVGLFGKSRPFTNHVIDLQPGDMIYLFSDGFADQFGGPKGKKYKSARFREFLSSIGDRPLPEQSVLLREEFQLWRGDLEQLDDVCIMGIKV